MNTGNFQNASHGRAAYNGAEHHTPTPYYHDGDGIVYAKQDKELADSEFSGDIVIIAETSPANADFIVCACNAYRPMLDALQVAEAELEHPTRERKIAKHVLPYVRSVAAFAVTGGAA